MHIFHEDESLRDRNGVRREIDSLEERYERLEAERPDLLKAESFDYENATKETSKVTLISNPTHIYGKEPEVFCQMMELEEQAESRVLIQTPYLVCNSYMLDQLDYLTDQVPDTRVLINSVENGDNFMASSDYLFRKGEILKTGITVYEYDGGQSSHGKSMVVDHDMAVIGSYNMDLRSTYVDTELMVAIHSREIAEELAGYMEYMQADSRKVTGPDTYEIPDHLTVGEIPVWKKAAMFAVGFLMQGFRCLV